MLAALMAFGSSHSRPSRACREDTLQKVPDFIESKEGKQGRIRYPRKRTWISTAVMSALCQKRTCGSCFCWQRATQAWRKPDGSGRAVGTVLAGPALESVKVGKSYYGEVPILGTPYITGYEPIMDSSGAQIGVYYIGYKK